MRRVIYVFLPRWPIDRLRRSGANPSLGATPADEKPFATVAESGGRRLLAAVNPAAAAAGLAAGMPLADALSFVPGLATTAAESAEDGAALTRLAEWCQRYSPWTAPDEPAGIKVEITGCAHLWGGEAALAADLSGRLARQRISHQIAIAGTLGAAWALARFVAADRHPAMPPPDGEREALVPLPVEALRLDPATATGLRRVGLRRVGELYPMPRDALARRFGEGVARRLDQALGLEPEPLSPLGETPARRVRLSFAEPIADPADLARGIERLAGDLAARLAREGMGARRLDLAFHRVDGRVEHSRIGTARPTRDAKHLAGLFKARLDTIDPGFGVEDMILALYAAEPLPPEQTPMPPLSSLHNNPLPGWGRGGDCAPTAGDWHNVAPLLDRIGARLGLEAVSHMIARESHIPERASVYASVIPGSPAGRGPEPMDTSLWNMGSGFRPAVGSGMTRMENAENTAKPPRPVRLFAPPEPVEAAWLLPDDPPFHFAWRRRLYRVRHADGPERIAEEWWAGAAMTADAVRDYYRVEDEAGRRFWLFRAGLPGDPPPRWFMHGVFA